MRLSIIDILKCLNCGGTDFRLTSQKHDEYEIICGKIECNNCKGIYKIQNGILDALTLIDPEVNLARACYRESKAKGFDSKISPQKMALRSHLDTDYVKDTTINFKDLIDRVGSGKGWALDIGAGTCWTTAGLAGKGYRCVAIDISTDNKLELGKYHFNTEVYFDRVLADINHLPFKEGAFSLAFSSAVLHHSSDMYLSLNEISRTLIANGRLELINEPVKGLLESFNSRAGRLEGPDGVIEKHYGIPKWMHYIKQGGFSGRYLFPESIRQRLKYGGFNKKQKFYPLTLFISALYNAGLGKYIFEKLLFHPGMYLLGLTLIYSGYKSREGHNISDDGK